MAPESQPAGHELPGPARLPLRRLTGPTAPDWQDPLAGLLPHDATLDEKSAEALHHLIAELEAQADDAQLALPSQCRLSTDNPDQVFEQSHPLGQWSYGFSQGVARWPTPTDLERSRHSLPLQPGGRALPVP